MKDDTTIIEFKLLELPVVNEFHVDIEPISKQSLIDSAVFAYEATGNVQYLNDLITLDKKAA